MTVVVAVDVVLEFRFLGGGLFRRRLLTILQNKTIITNTKMMKMTGTDTPIPIDTLDADAA